jgi:hypothetical protein
MKEDDRNFFVERLAESSSNVVGIVDESVGSGV